MAMTKRRSIADRLRAKGFPPLSEEQYQDNIRALVPTVCFCEETDMTTDNKHKWECISPGEYDTTYKCSACGALFTDQADDPNSLIPEFGCTVNTELSSKTVEELTTGFPVFVGSVGCYWVPIENAKELERRLEEAQQQLELYAAEMSDAKAAGFYSAQELWSAYQTAQQKIAAQQARIAEQSKLIDQLIDTDGADARLAARVLSRTDDLSLLAAHDAAMKAEALEEETYSGDYYDDQRDKLLKKAAEYRAKATEAGRKE